MTDTVVFCPAEALVLRLDEALQREDAFERAHLSMPKADRNSEAYLDRYATVTSERGVLERKLMALTPLSGLGALGQIAVMCGEAQLLANDDDEERRIRAGEVERAMRATGRWIVSTHGVTLPAAVADFYFSGASAA